MKIVGQVSTAQEAKEMESIVKLHIVGIHARKLALKMRKIP